MTAIYPGSFDPMTYGHLDIIQRAAKITDKLIVSVLQNSAKKPFFSVEERMEILRESVSGIKNVEIGCFSGLLADYAKECGTSLVIRGLRAVTDFEYEFQMALTNRLLCPDLETLFISTSTEYLYLGSGVIKEIAMHGGDISKMAPSHVVDRLNSKIMGTH
ncbi:MAG: pantetheine-phosphate adenylyltransferase [Defluviitaleaceae bacterium]|nr:pantetheine-phosphate adenylyltransferase [Defluviitaleaceae bacterium]MCL2835704.1 pantetheine-phosphate adenylyltransferase [Defluviitaleaceae bacterium]